MRCLILQKVYKKRYYLGYCRQGFYLNLNVDERNNYEGSVLSDTDFIKDEIILETSNLTQDLKVGEFIKLKNDKDYEIHKVAYATNGDVYYYIEKERIIEDEESKKKAEADLEARKIILADRARIKSELELKMENMKIGSNPEMSFNSDEDTWEKDVKKRYSENHHKWYQFWK